MKAALRGDFFCINAWVRAAACSHLASARQYFYPDQQSCTGDREEDARLPERL